MKKLFALFELLSFIACLAVAGQAWAAAVADDKAVADFYRGKTVRLIVGFSAGGGYDAYTRLIGRHLQKHIPGNPSIIIENMAGAGSIILANHMYNAAPKDGTVIGNFSGQIILEQQFGNPAVQFDLAKFRFLGVPIGETYLLLATKKSGIAKFDDLIGSKSKQLTIGGIPGSTVEQGPMLLRDLLGANIKVVSGYKGTADVRLAMESGELDGFFNSWESTKVTSLDRVKNGDWQILAQVGDQPIAALPVKNVPTIAQIAKTEEQQQLLRFGAYAPNQFAKVYTVPPGTPADRAAALESALTKTFADKEFLAEADKGKLDIDPVSATQVQKLVNEFFGLPAELKAKLKKILKP
ncbi:MAG: tripartite tricarboxylate transporter substrate-binding protein [Candidatus Binatota bacterium]|nr:tripartite tricarboxylate transporter substrate-binding protein [Candidatus Binatota bacterium]